MASEAVSDRGMWDLNPKGEGAKQEETAEWQRFFRQMGTCGSRRNTVLGGWLRPGNGDTPRSKTVVG